MKSRLVGLLVLSLLFFCGVESFAQSTNGTITGTVKDSSGAALPTVRVSIVNEDTGLARNLVTDNTGHYLVPSLPLGHYRVTASLQGFETGVHSGILLTVGREVVVDLTLAVGAVTQNVEVTGDVPLVETTTGSLGSLVDQKSIRELPLNGRSYDQLALLQPGVVLTSPGQTGGAPFTYGTGSRFSVGGQRSIANSFLLDGTNISDQANGTPGGAAGTNLGVDTILEFQIFTNSFKAEYGRTSGSVTTAVTRSGTNELHGTAFEYIRNSALDAKNYFDPGSSPPPFRRNQFGGVIGGPIVKNKTFFFAGYEGLRQGLANTQTAIVPNLQGRNGILPTGTVTVNPAIVPYLNLYPLPNGTVFSDGTGLYLSAPLVATNEDNAMVRVDHQLTSSTSIFGRYTFDTDSVNGQQNLPILSLDQATRREYSTIQANSVLSSKAVNNARFAFNRTHSVYDPAISGVPSSLSIIPGQEFGALQIGGVTVGGGTRALTALGSPNTGSGLRSWTFNVFEGSDDFSYVAGKHSLKTGVDIQRLQDNTSLGNVTRGAYTFSSVPNFLQGKPSNLQASSPLGVLPTWNLRQSLIALYGQDDYTVNSRLTLNLGLRWEMATDPIDTRGQMSNLIPPSAPTMTVTDRFFTTGKKNFEPRFGLAWSLDSAAKTVLRAGAGIYHNELLPYFYANNILNPPFFGRYSVNNPPFPNGYAILKPGVLQTSVRFTPNMKTTASDQFNLSIERQIARNTLVQIAYIGNYGDHLETERQIDTNTPVFLNGNPATPFYPVGAPRLNPNFAGVVELATNGNSRYNAGQIALRKQSSNGLQGQIFYTFSKSLDDTSGISGSDSVRTPQAVQNPWDIGQDWALSDFDERHQVGFNFTYRLPFRVTSRALGAVINGWGIDGIGRFASGMPFTLRLASSVSRDGSTVLAERPNLNPGFSNNPTNSVSAGCAGFAAGTPVGTPQHWYDPCAFSLPAAGTYGNLGRNTVIGPGLQDVDMALAKTFKVRESIDTTFRAEMFNVFNHANFGLPNTNPLQADGTATASAGIITYTQTPSRQIQFGLRISF